MIQENLITLGNQGYSFHMHLPDPRAVKRVAIIGAGTIGASWAAHFLARGMDV
jgi:NADPH-dependent 2,4-dienoyl-CoA reductase/sulfur reductase-like enzyme